MKTNCKILGITPTSFVQKAMLSKAWRLHTNGFRLYPIPNHGQLPGAITQNEDLINCLASQ
ncbi:hypothetical protein [Caldithrix abyssi]|uniref:Uncharacterized protein n=1 Tax=Caldithrix abyssi DSM 13497 TaxID=880073 RepID=A0A1J1CF07_CALAY|nr:hypothetical protein [Caldithrix abyssi]APF20594.1 hypothetical protein Cabys_3849 [Caldithrix abyssi DSM 13497]